VLFRSYYRGDDDERKKCSDQIARHFLLREFIPS
jgi:hypothetical protein